jgi:acyl-coenzyme A synthetase/AMP-(fatty) acid ligase
MVDSRALNRLRVLLDRRLTAANALDRAAAAHPDSEVFHLTAATPYRDLPAGAVTPRALLPFVNKVGNVLLGLGLRRGDRVAIYHTNGPEYFFLALAVIKAGGTVVPVNSGMPVDELGRHLRAADCHIVMTDGRQFAEMIGDIDALPDVHMWVFPDLPAGFTGKGIALNAALTAASEHLAPAPLDADATVLLVHTSGTTGRPKLVPSTSGRLISGVKRHYVDEPIARHNRTAVAGHFNHLVYYVGLYSSLMGNLPVWTIGEHTVEEITRTITTARIAIFFAFPDVYARIYRHGLPDHAFDSVRIWVTTADAAHDVHMEAFCGTGAYLRLGGRVLVRSLFIEAFGTSEVGFAAVRRVRFPFSPRRFDRIVGRRTLAGPRMRVVDAVGTPVAANTVGRIMVSGPTVFTGYWDPEDAGRHVAPADGWWWTGDLGRRNRFGTFFQLARALDVIRTATGPVYPLPIEEALLAHPAVGDAAVIGVPHPSGGEVAVAIVCPIESATLRAGDVLDWMRGRPSLVDVHDVKVLAAEDLPRGLTGKILRRVLRERYAGWFG